MLLLASYAFRFGRSNQRDHPYRCRRDTNRFPFQYGWEPISIDLHLKGFTALQSSVIVIGREANVHPACVSLRHQCSYFHNFLQSKYVTMLKGPERCDRNRPGPYPVWQDLESCAISNYAELFGRSGRMRNYHLQWGRS